MHFALAWSPETTPQIRQRQTCRQRVEVTTGCWGASPTYRRFRGTQRPRRPQINSVLLCVLCDLCVRSLRSLGLRAIVRRAEFRKGALHFVTCSLLRTRSTRIRDRPVDRGTDGQQIDRDHRL